MLDYERRHTPWARLALGSLAATLIAAPGCHELPKLPDDLPGETEGDPTETEGSPQPDTDTDSSQPDTDPSGEDSSATDSGPVVPPWSDVPCGDVTCSGPEVCVVPGLDCNYGPCRQDMEAEWIMGPPECQPLPDDCDPSDPKNCLEAEYCGPGSEFGSFQDGVMECGPIALDCYCF